jgi:tripartite motif-containing protein 71
MYHCRLRRLPNSAWLIPLTLALSLALALPAAAQGYHFVRQWGSRGSGDGQFKSPQAVAVDAAGNVYVVDQDNNRVQKFTREGGFVAKWGSEGAGPGQFDYPCGVAVDAAGNVYVAEEDNCRIQVFTGEGVFVRQWGSRGSGEGQFTYQENLGGGLAGLAVDHEGFVYAIDNLLNRVQKFTSEGRFVTQWGSEGKGHGQFDMPRGVAVDAKGQVYVADTFNARIQKFTPAGVYVTGWGTKGANPGQFKNPWGVAVDAKGQVFVADHNADDFITGEDEALISRLEKFTGAGGFLAQWGEPGEDPGQLGMPVGLAVDKDGKVYVADPGNSHIMVYAPD